MADIKSILDMDCNDAKKFLLKSESYSTLDLPPYFKFNKLLTKIEKIIHIKPEGNSHHETYTTSTFNKKEYNPRSYDDINYTIYTNKDGRYAWRPIKLIHPVFYTLLVEILTQEENWQTIKTHFSNCSRNNKICCTSVPVESTSNKKDKAEQISNWVESNEEQSILLALDYKYIFHTDITDCYGSFYTHTITWALHGKDIAKTCAGLGKNNKKSKSKNKKSDKNALLGNKIDAILQDMSSGQTNGIPQGSVLMDLLAEVLLAYIDCLLGEKLDTKISDYYIIRYRDDYRIFTNTQEDGEIILKVLTEVLMDFGFKLSAQKTASSNDIITASLKVDKLYRLPNKLILDGVSQYKTLDSLLVIYQLSKQYPNQGIILIALRQYYYKILHIDKNKINKKNVLISIIVEIAIINPRAYPYCAAILSLLLLQNPDKKNIIEKIFKKFQSIPNTEYLSIWLQRISIHQVELTDTNISKHFINHGLCKLLLNNKDVKLWNNEWLKGFHNKKIKKSLQDEMSKSENLIDPTELKEIKDYITSEEVDTFKDLNYQNISAKEIEELLKSIPFEKNQSSSSST